MSTTLELLKASAVTQIQSDLTAAVAASASAANASALAAASSASTALQAIAAAFKGGLAGASVPATSTATGDTYRITAVGTSQGKTWAIGDAAIYNGSSGNWTQLTGWFAYADAADLAATAALIEREGLRFDGTTVAKVNIPIPILGTSPYTIIAEKEFGQPNGTWDAIIGGSPGALIFGKSSYNTLNTGATLGVTCDGSETINQGDRGIYAATFDGATVRFYINGRLSSTHTAAINVSAVTDIFGASSVFALRSIGSLSRAIIFNYTLTQPEIAALIRRGLTTLPENKKGSFTNLITNASRNSTFSALATDWVVVSYTTVTAASGALVVTNTASVEIYVALTAANLDTTAFKVGSRIRISGTIVANTTGSLVSVSAASGADKKATGASQTGAFSVETTITSSHWGDFGISFGTYGAVGSGTSITLDNIVIIPLGTLFEQDSGHRHAGYMVGDTSGNNADLILPTTGVSIINPDPRGGSVRTKLTWAGTHEGKSLLGQIALPVNAVITRVTTKASAASTGSGLTLGSTWTPNRYVALAPFTTDKKVHTLANGGLPSGTSSTDLDLVLDPDTANYTGTIDVLVEYILTPGNPV